MLESNCIYICDESSEADLGSVEKVGVRALAAPVSDIRNQLIS